MCVWVDAYRKLKYTLDKAAPAWGGCRVLWGKPLWWSKISVLKFRDYLETISFRTVGLFII